MNGFARRLLQRVRVRHPAVSERRVPRFLRGNTLTEWAVPFVAFLAVLTLLQVSYRRTLQGKIMGSADYFFWKAYGQDPQDYKGDINTRVKTMNTQYIDALSVQAKSGNMGIKASMAMHLKQSGNEQSASTGTDDYSRPMLRTMDVNKVVR